MAQTFDELIAALPASIDTEFEMSAPDEPIRLAVGRIELSRDGHSLGSIDGEVLLEWKPRVQIICAGDSDTAIEGLDDDGPLDLRVPQLGLDARALVTNIRIGERHEVRALLLGTDNSALLPAENLRFYLVNFPSVFGELVRHGKAPHAGAGRYRLRMTAGPFVCTVDQIASATHIADASKGAGYLLTHVCLLERTGAPIRPDEAHHILDALYWLFAFLRGGRTGPVLPSSGSPFTKYWVAIEQWAIGEARRVDTWLPSRSALNLDSLFDAFIDKWNEPVWNEGLRTTLAWYVTANAPSTPNEARITLCQIALEVLASLKSLEDGTAHVRIRGLLLALSIPTDVPPRLQALCDYAANNGVDAVEALTRIRNKFEHPTIKNRAHAASVDGTTRMEAAQYGLELLELCLLGILGYEGRYARRAFQGWKGEEEAPVPWAPGIP